MKVVFDPVNQVWCKIIPSGITFAEWREWERESVVEKIMDNGQLRGILTRRALQLAMLAHS